MGLEDRLRAVRDLVVGPAYGRPYPHSGAGRGSYGRYASSHTFSLKPAEFCCSPGIDADAQPVLDPAGYGFFGLTPGVDPDLTQDAPEFPLAMF